MPQVFFFFFFFFSWLTYLDFMVQRGGDHSYCVQNFLSPATMRMIDGMRTQLLGELTSRGFVGSLEEGSSQGHRADLVRAVLVGYLYLFQGRKYFI